MGLLPAATGEGIEESMDSIPFVPAAESALAQAGGTLSGGEQQMLAVGRALMAKPRLLLMDEPSMGLAPILVEEIFDIIREIRREGVTILLVEQELTDGALGSRPWLRPGTGAVGWRVRLRSSPGIHRGAGCLSGGLTGA